MKQMKEIAKEIIAIKIKQKDTFQSCFNRFYKIMDKYGIKEGTPNYNKKGQLVSVTRSSSDWTMCRILFMDNIHSQLNWEFLFRVPSRFCRFKDKTKSKLN